MRLSLALIVACMLFCIPAQAGAEATYTVRSGDNLTHIAKRYGLTVSQLRSANHLKSDVIHVGQKLKLNKPFSRRSSGRITWISPVARPGRVLVPYGQYKRKGILMPQTGAEISCPIGTAIRLPADGIVRHVGPLEGFGTLVIVEHAGNYATVLAPLDPTSISFRVGEAKRRGDPLGKTATPEDGRDPYLHVELRRNDKSIPPDRLLR